MKESDSVQLIWDAFLVSRPDLANSTTPYSAWHFGDNQELADRLADLVMTGRKHATTGALWSYEFEGEPVPRVGDLSVVTRWNGEARCIIRTTSVDIVPFDRVSSEFAAGEAVGDGSLEQWREAHWDYFTRELRSYGTEPQWDMPVACERFEVVFGANSCFNESVEETGTDRVSGRAAVSYVEEFGHFRVDLSGHLDAQSLTSRHDELVDSLREHLTPGQTIRLLFDTRKAHFESPGVHRMMRQLFCRPSGEFSEHAAVAAILNPHRTGSPAPAEAFFTDEAEALHWLASAP